LNAREFSYSNRIGKTFSGIMYARLAAAPVF